MQEITLQRLEYFKIKENVMEYAISYLGKQHVNHMQVLMQYKAVRIALDETDEALAIIKRGGSVPIPSLSGMDTVLNLLGTGYVFTEQDFSNIHMFLHSCMQLRKYMTSKITIAPRISQYASSIYELAKLKSEIERCFQSGRITDAASKELNKVRKKMIIVEERIKNKINSIMAKHRTIMQENLISMRGDRYVLPIKKEYRKQLRGSVLDESSSGQTVYIEPAEIANLQYEIIDLRMEEAREEAKILAYLTSMVEDSQNGLRINVETAGVYDFLFAKAKYALSIGGCNVELNAGGIINLRGAIHPLLGAGTVPLNFAIGSNYKSLIITGPNTGGKTVSLKTVGLLTLMVQSGLLVPVEAGSTFSIFTKVYADIGDGQSIEQSLSTFSAHIKNVIELLKNADNTTLVLLDEMASGTDPGEGVALSIAILEELQRRGTTVVATTHFNEIKHFASVTPEFENARMEFDANTLKPMYQLRIGEAGYSYAFLIAQNLGISPDIIRRSKEIAIKRGVTNNHNVGFNSISSETKQETMLENKTNVIQENDKIKEMNHNEDDSISVPLKRYEVGDSVYVSYLKRTGIVYKEEDAKGNVGVMIQKQKLNIYKKRLSLHIQKKELYPDDYDFDIIFETKENRKKKNLMKRKHVEGLNITKKPNEE